MILAIFLALEEFYTTGRWWEHCGAIMGFQNPLGALLLGARFFFPRFEQWGGWENPGFLTSGSHPLFSGDFGQHLKARSFPPIGGGKKYTRQFFGNNIWGAPSFWGGEKHPVLQGDVKKRRIPSWGGDIYPISKTSADGN